MDTNRWNIAFTNMIRLTNQAAWGNWTLDPSILPGAVGFIDPVTGSFTAVSTIPNPKINRLPAPEMWSVESSSVYKNQSEVDFKGGYKDPSTGKEVNVGLDVTWSFSKENSIVSNATLTARSMVEDFGRLMEQNFAWLLEQAKSVGYASGDGIVQGFGMITHAQHSAGGLNVGSLNQNSTFSLIGSIDGINAMTGGGNINASIKGSYKETKQSSAFESHMWPAEANQAAPGEMGISYQFASYDGKLIMPTWITPLSGFTVVFDNAHGGTYIGNCSVEYNVPGSSQLITKSTKVPGGQVHTITGIPLDATNLQIKIHFQAGSDFYHRSASPISTWLTGQRTVDMWGVWPWGSHAKIRETDSMTRFC